jgi:molecular chaperone DnaK (HSP70)
MKSLFQETIDRIIGLIKSVLTDTNARGISTILLVGGFSECHLAQAAIRDAFSDKTIISPVQRRSLNKEIFPLYLDSESFVEKSFL